MPARVWSRHPRWKKLGSPTASETSLVNACLIWLRMHGCMVWRLNTGAATYGQPGQRQRFVRFGPVGQPDIIGFGPPPDGRGVSVECKRGKNTLTWAQEQFMSQAQSQGAFAVCVYSVDELMAKWAHFHASRDPEVPDMIERAEGGQT